MTRRIGFDARMLGRTGIGTYVEGLLGTLPAALDNDRLIVFAQPETRALVTELTAGHENVEVFEAPGEIYRLREQLGFPLRLARGRLDLLHTPHYNQPLLYGGPSVITIHDLIPLVYPGIHSSLVPRVWNRVLISRAAKAARALIAPSQQTADDLRIRLRVPPAKVAVIPEAASDGFAPTGDQEQQRRWLARFQIRPPFFIYFGQWKPYKNLPQLIDAYRAVLVTNPNLQLVIGGREDPRFPAAKEAAARLPGQVVVTGWVPSEAVPHLYRAAAVFVLPSLYEGFGLPVLEAMASGTPVVCTRATSLPEVAGDAAQYWEPSSGTAGLASAIGAALEPQNATRLRRLGLAQAARFSWAETARRTVALYHAALQSRAPRSAMPDQ